MMVVDDNLRVTCVIEKCLADVGVDVRAINDSWQAIAIAQS
jgi:CheY-like chemotaxis protein